MQFIAKSFVYSAALSVLLGRPVQAEDDHHHHLENRAMVTQYVYQTIVVDQDGSPVVLAETANAAAAADTAAGVATTTSLPAATPETTPVAEQATSEAAPAVTTTSSPAPVEEETTTSSPEPVTTSSASSTSSSSTAESTSITTNLNVGKTTTSNSGGINGDLAVNQSPEDFEDGTISCSDFPVGQGVIDLDWVGLGGWSGIQFNDNGATSTGSSCVEGAFCSYSCQAGMAKTQWPSDQPSSGVSVGGLQCKNGKLYRTNTAFSSLCVWGKGSAIVKSEIDSGVAICRTDYPGTENMVVPTWLDAGSSNQLCVIDSDNYFTWRGGLTSAQYYVNDAGVSVEDGCVWGSSSGTVGNWAPLNIGAGSTDGVSWLALIPNPNNRSPASYSVKIVATDGSSVNGECVYENGKFNGGDSGCTVSVMSGQGAFVFY